LFPKLSDEASLARYRKSRTLETAASDTQRKEAAGLREEFTEAGDLLGVGLAVQIVPGPAGSVADVVAGSPQAIQPIAQQRYYDVWAHPAAATHDLVVATIAGDRVQQSWENVARAVEVAEAFVRPGGAIAIRSELASPPGPAVRRLANV